MRMRALMAVMMMHGRWWMMVLCRGRKRRGGQRVRGTETACRRGRFALIVSAIRGSWAGGMDWMIIVCRALDVRVSRCHMRVLMVCLRLWGSSMLMMLLLMIVMCELESVAHLWTGRTRRTGARYGCRVANGVGEAAMCVPIVIGA